jgi:hypothetical protein
VFDVCVCVSARVRVRANVVWRVFVCACVCVRVSRMMAINALALAFRRHCAPACPLGKCVCPCPACTDVASNASSATARRRFCMCAQTLPTAYGAIGVLPRQHVSNCMECLFNYAGAGGAPALDDETCARVRVCVCVCVRVCVNAAQRICNSGQCFRLAFATPPLRPATKFVPMAGERLHAHVSRKRAGSTGPNCISFARH